MNSNTILSVEEIENTTRAWLGQEVLVSHRRLYSGGVSAVPYSTYIADYMGILRFARSDSFSFRLMSETGEEIAEIHAVYAIEAEPDQLFVSGWVGDSTTHEWSRWIIEK